MAQPEVLWFEDITIADVPSVGSKNASRGEMVRELGKSGVRVPAGFATTAGAYRSFLAANRIEPAMRASISGATMPTRRACRIRAAPSANSLPPAFLTIWPGKSLRPMPSWRRD